MIILSGKNIIGTRIMNRTWLPILLLLFMLVVVGCGSKSDMVTEDSTSSPAYDNKAEMEMDVSTSDAIYDSDAGSPGSGAMEAVVDTRKYIRTFNYQIETLTFKETQAKLFELIDLNKGYLESTQVSGKNLDVSYYQRQTGTYVVRIPSDLVDTFNEGLIGIGNIIDSRSGKEDVTNQYFDLDARIKTLEVQEERLLAILEDADELQYVIELERELADVRYEIESYMTSFRDLDNRISYSTIYITLQEVFIVTELKEPPKGFFEKMTTGFMDTLEGVIDFLTELVLFMIINIPVFIVLLIFAFIIYKIVKAFHKRREKKKAKYLAKQQARIEKEKAEEASKKV